MFGSTDAVLGQIAYARTVRSIIRETMRRMLDGGWIKHIFASSDEEFDRRLDDALKSLDFRTATPVDCCKTVVDILCDEVCSLCHALKTVCEASGYGEYYTSHISHDRFVRLVLSVDTTKTGKMLKIVEDESLTPIDVLRGVGAVLNDESLEERAALSERERRRANAELKSLAADVKTTMQLGFDRAEQKMLECKDEIKSEVKSGVDAVGAKVAAVDEKVSKLKSRGKRRGKYDEAVVAFCVACVDAAKGKEILRNSKNGKQNLEDVFVYYRGELERRGIADFAMFKRIIHAYRASESRARIKATEAKHDAAQAVAENGIIRGMKKNAKSALALALTIAGAFAAPLCSDAALDIFSPAAGHMLGDVRWLLLDIPSGGIFFTYDQNMNSANLA